MNNYYVIEIQTNADGTSGVLPYGFATSDEAESKYLAVRNAALLSNVLIHTVLWIDNKGHTFEKKSYVHPQPEPEQEAGE